MSNVDYFNYSKDNPEEAFDPFYAKDLVIIPKTSDESNLLTKSNMRLIELFTTFDTLHGFGNGKNDDNVRKVVNEVISIMKNTQYINYSPFSQFLMVYNLNYSIFKNKNSVELYDQVYQMLVKYCDERHKMYLSHGYSNSILQVLCDNYSHKRNGKTGIEKICSMLEPYDVIRLTSQSMLDNYDNYYFLPDKGDKNLFNYFLNHYGLRMESRDMEQDKLPDIVFKHNGEYYICELKTMKEGGGGQNKQIVEMANFITYSEDSPRFHYLVFLDGQYFNFLMVDQSPKIKKQREDIISALNRNASNYFVNTKGMKKLIDDLFTSSSALAIDNKIDNYT